MSGRSTNAAQRARASGSRKALVLVDCRWKDSRATESARGKEGSSEGERGGRKEWTRRRTDLKLGVEARALGVGLEADRCAGLGRVVVAQVVGEVGLRLDEERVVLEVGGRVGECLLGDGDALVHRLDSVLGCREPGWGGGESERDEVAGW